MSKLNSEPAANLQEVQVDIVSDKRSPAYANLVNISASDAEITFNFIYVNAQDNPAGTLVSRVVVPRMMLGKITDMLVETAEAAGRRD